MLDFHISSVILPFTVFSSSSFFRRASSIQTDKNAEAALAAAIGDWSSGIIWAFVRSFKGPLH